MAEIPKIVWCLWLQGWGNAPRVANACLESWRRRNPDWQVHALDQISLNRFLPASELDWIFTREMPYEAASDCIRISLLHRFGGVWVDATTMCMQPLNDWLPERMCSGFFAFANPGPGRMLSSWFLAALKGDYIVDRWRQSVTRYWAHRAERDDYFWFHKLFAGEYEADPSFRILWDAAPSMPAAHAAHFSPDDEVLSAEPSSEHLAWLNVPPSPVFKLTHKLGDSAAPGSLLDFLCKAAERLPVPSTPVRPRLLVSWYGTFEGHGTIGDLRALEALVTHLVGRAHKVCHATAMEFEITGAERVTWPETSLESYDAVIFVCGPILGDHRQTTALFEWARQRPFIGVAVSLLPTTDPQHTNPFDVTLAREGSSERFGDLAIISPAAVDDTAKGGATVGIVLGGAQSEYGADKCLWQETESLVHGALNRLPGLPELRLVTIENHLKNAGREPDEIEREYTKCDLVITSRFHGAIEAIRCGVPFIAIDQIRGGAKVTSLLGGLGWPFVHRVEELDEVIMADEILCLLREPHSKLPGVRLRAVSDANRTLRRLDEVLSALTPRSRRRPWHSPPYRCRPWRIWQSVCRIRRIVFGSVEPQTEHLILPHSSRYSISDQIARDRLPRVDRLANSPIKP